MGEFIGNLFVVLVGTIGEPNALAWGVVRLFAA